MKEHSQPFKFFKKAGHPCNLGIIPSKLGGVRTCWNDALRNIMSLYGLNKNFDQGLGASPKSTFFAPFVVPPKEL